jgi:rod shape-determining protein MreB
MNKLGSVLIPNDHRQLKPSEPNGKGRFDVCSTNGHGPATERAVLQLGFDWGTNKSCLKGSYQGRPDLATDHIVPTIVGYAKDGIVDGLLPGNASVLFGEEAIRQRLHLNLVQPMVEGVIRDAAAAREYARHLRSLMDIPPGTEVRAVIGMPANASTADRESIREAVAGLFDRVILIPEPFLAALGYREETRLNEPGYVDPVRNSLLIDIGGGTTDLCLVQGYFPTAEEQVSLPFAGDKVDALLHAAIRKTYPDCGLTLFKVRELKEKNSYVGTPNAPVVGSVMVNGKLRRLDLTEHMAHACSALLEQILASAKQLIAHASPDSVGELLQNIILTGGGSRIRGLDTELQRLLAAEGYEQPCVRRTGDRYQEFVALGALKAARQAREDQWQQVVQ